MKLSSPITLNPPPTTDPQTNKVVTPDPIVLEELNIVYHDDPQRKHLYATVDKVPGYIYLATGNTYDGMADYTQSELPDLFANVIGSDPQQIQASLQANFPRTLEQDPNGPGTLLTGMISTLGIKSSSTCSCRRHALEMNDKGPDWCQENIETILSWLKDESKKRNLPYVDAVARVMVNRAINKSRKLQAKEAQQAEIAAS